MDAASRLKSGGIDFRFKPIRFGINTRFERAITVKTREKNGRIKYSREKGGKRNGTYVCIARTWASCDALQTHRAFRMYAMGMYLMWQLCVANARYLGVSTI